MVKLQILGIIFIIAGSGGVLLSWIIGMSELPYLSEEKRCTIQPAGIAALISLCIAVVGCILCYIYKHYAG